VSTNISFWVTYRQQSHKLSIYQSHQNPLVTLPLCQTVHRVANKSIASWQQVCCVVVMEFGKRHDTTDTTDFRETGVMDFVKTCYGEFTNLIRTCYGETGVVDFGLYHANLIQVMSTNSSFCVT